MLTKEQDYRVSLLDSIIEDLERLSMPELTRVYKFIRTHVIANIPGLQPPDSKESASAIPQQPQPSMPTSCNGGGCPIASTCTVSRYNSPECRQRLAAHAGVR